MNSRLVSVVLAAVLLPACASADNKPATVREYSKTFRTYPFGDPDPVPRLGAKGQAIYPYFRFDGFADKPVDKAWKVVELENDYLRLMILPEVGGKIWAAFEKSTGKSFVYYNHVVKFRDIAMRGPWTSGGVEANYGIVGHTPNCATPVDYLVRTGDDGSASCVIGCLDLLTRTPWRLEIRLEKDKAYFATRSFWFNPTPLEQPYYSWMNVGIKAANDLEFIYPGTSFLGHDGEHGDWPVNRRNNKDVFRYKNNDFGQYKSYHVFGRYTDFFGAYYHDEDFGMGRYSTHDNKPGKKIWIWGLSRQGMIWEQLLTDTDGQYVEVQSGRLFNQTVDGSTFTPFKHRGFAPGSADTWTEYWFPIKGTKGLVHASPYGALNLKQEDGKLKIAFCPLQPTHDRLEVRDGDEMVYSKQLTLQAMEVFEDSLEIKSVPKTLKAALGGHKLSYDSDPKATELSRPLDSPPKFDWNGVYGLYLQGKEHIRGRRYPAAQAKLEECLKKDPHFLPALSEMALLMYRFMDYAKADEYAAKALSIDTYDPAANFARGLACQELGRMADARDGLDIAAASIEYRSAADSELADLYMREKNHDRAEHYARKALDYNRFNLNALEVQAIAARLRNQREQAASVLDKMLAIDPLNHFALFEKTLQGTTGVPPVASLSRGETAETPVVGEQKAFKDSIRNEMPDQTYLELAIRYSTLARLEEAGRVLALAPRTPEIACWQAWLAHRSGQKKEADALLKEADSLSPALAFPFRPESAQALRWAITRTQSWKPRYFLALIWWNCNNLDKARELFGECGDRPDFAPFYVVRARLLPQNAEADLKKAISIDRQWRYGYALAAHYLSAGRAKDAAATAGEFLKQSPDNYVLGLLRAKALLRAGELAQCDLLLRAINVLPNEGAVEGRLIYKECQLLLAVHCMKNQWYDKALGRIAASRLWPENLGVGKPYPEDVDERLEDFLQAACLDKLGKKDQAAALREKMLKSIPPADASPTNALVLALTHKSAGGPQAPAAVLEKLGDTPLGRWCRDACAAALRPPPATADENARVLYHYLRDQ